MSPFDRLPRFGRALAKLRTKLGPKIKTDAKRFLRDAKKAKKDGKLKSKPLTQGFSSWTKHANLDPVFQYLTS